MLEEGRASEVLEFYLAGRSAGSIGVRVPGSRLFNIPTKLEALFVLAYAAIGGSETWTSVRVFCYI